MKEIPYRIKIGIKKNTTFIYFECRVFFVLVKTTN